MTSAMNSTGTCTGSHVKSARTTNRTWNDVNRNYTPDCVLLNPVANGECGPWADLNFGKPTAGTKYSPNALSGFNTQYQNWQGSIALQHELRPGMGLNVGYYRTWYGGRCGGRSTGRP